MVNCQVLAVKATLMVKSFPNFLGSQILEGQEFTPSEHRSGNITWHFNSYGDFRPGIYIYLLGQMEGQLEEKVRKVLGKIISAVGPSSQISGLGGTLHSFTPF